jgi:hypothetical protein
MRQQHQDTTDAPVNDPPAIERFMLDVLQAMRGP